MKIPDGAKQELAAIFTDDYLPAVEKACERYLRESQECKPSIPKDGQALLSIAEKATELKALIESSESALKRMRSNFPGWGNRLYALRGELRALAIACELTPETEQAKPKKGRPKGAVDEPERGLAFHLAAIYRAAHGSMPSRKVDRTSGAEAGPLPRAAAILGPVLHLRSDLARHFRTIEEDLKLNGH